ncbi:aryl-sulfate sulfotransferase [Myxococcota bacterium]
MKRRALSILAALLSTVGISLLGCDDGKNRTPPWDDRTYNLEIDAEQWSEPPGVGQIIGSYVPTFLLGVTEASDTTIHLVGALVAESGNTEQDMCQETIAFPQGGMGKDLFFTAGPADFPIVVDGSPVTIHDLFIAGTFRIDGSYFDGGSFEGVLDAREFAERFGTTDSDAVCDLVASIGASCEACPYDGEEYCLTVRADNIRADEVPDLTIMQVGAQDIDPGCTDAIPQCQVSDKLAEFQPGVLDGYTLYAPRESETTYLIDICGEVVHSWQSTHTPGHPACLLENGHLLRTGSTGNQNFNPGGTRGIVEQLDWDGNLVWEYELSSGQYCQHHDIEMMPNGNVLMIVWEKKTREQAIAAGRDPDKLSYHELWPDSIIEVEPTYPKGGTIVWEWHIWDHLIQDFDSQKDNYGVVENHPELLDINFTGTDRMGQGADWNHTNSIDYNPDLDQILLSFHTTSEIIVIDHSTTTQDAAGHTGGRGGKGGDVLFRWGNPQAYRAGRPDDQQLFGQHNAHWIGSGLPGEDHILVFNNGMGRGYSSVDEIVPPVDIHGDYSLTPGSAFGPDYPSWTYAASNQTDFFSPAVSSAQRLPNGNTLICSGKDGVFFEVTEQGGMVWQYLSSEGTVFRVNRYAPDHAGLAGKELAP